VTLPARRGSGSAVDSAGPRARTCPPGGRRTPHEPDRTIYLALKNNIVPTTLLGPRKDQIH
jgi:hypothetical protein